MVCGRASRPGVRATFILLNSWASLLPNCLAHSPFPASWIPWSASEAGPSKPPLSLAPGLQLLLKGLWWKDNSEVTWSEEFSGDRLDPRLLEVPCRICSHVWDGKAETCWTLYMDSEHTGFLRSLGRTMVHTGTGRECQNAISLSHPRDHLKPTYSPSSCGINNVSDTRGNRDLHLLELAGWVWFHKLR